MKYATLFKSISKSLLLLTFFTPFIVTTFSIFPYEFGKTLFYNTLVQFAFVFFLVYLIVDFKDAWADITARFSSKRSLILRAAVIVLITMAISTIFAQAPYIAFWGNLDRNEGLIAFLHYAVFIALTYILFNKSDWYLYFCGLFLSTILLSVFAWLQYLGISGRFIIDIKPSSQPGSFAGNPVYLSSFLMIFILFTMALFDVSALKKRPWVTAVSAVLLVSTILITGIRGELLGLLAAFLVFAVYAVFKSKHVVLKRAAIGALVLLTLFVGVFLATRSNPIWIKIPTISRFATLTKNSNSLVTRLYTWQAGWEGFKEHWFLGWGQEGYNMIFNKYGSGAVARFGDDWFDRPHNKMLDVMDYGGILGTLAYFGLFGSLLYVYRKRPLFVAFFAAYFIQSLFIFDTNLTYLVLMAIIAWSAQHETGVNDHNELRHASPVSRKTRNIVLSVSALTIPFVLYVFVTTNLVPLKQQLLFTKLISAPTFEERAGVLYDVLHPDNWTQPRVRMFVNQMLREWKTVGRQGGIEAALTGVEALEAILPHDPQEARYYMRLAEGYMELAAKDKKYYEKAELYATQGTQIAPHQQKLFYLLSFILAREGKYDSSIEVQKRAVAIDPGTARSHLYLALNEISAAEPGANPYYDPLDPKFKEYLKDGIAALYKTFELASTKTDGSVMKDSADTGDVQFHLFEKSDFNNLCVLFAHVGDIDMMLKSAEIGLHVYKNEQVMYQYMIGAYVHQKDSVRLQAVFEAMKSAPYANQLPLVQWGKLAKAEEWKELNKHAFIGNFSALFDASPLKVDAATATTTQ